MHLFDLTGRRILVTGSNGEIGYSLAFGLAPHGATVILNGRNAEKLHAAADLLRAEGLSVERARFDAFILSVKFAKYVSPDDTLREAAIGDISLKAEKIATEDASRPPADDYCEGEKYVLVLDRDGKRRFIVQSPPIVSQEELERIKSWLSFQLLVERGG
jgi:nucleoside-diphosphate-sugar epimerase